MSQTYTTRGNSQQLEAIQHTDGPLLIIAGPGSGKTFTLVERIAYLVTEKSVQPENLLVVTFTDKAAQELVTRISNKLTELDVYVNLNDMYLGTFHSICMRWVEEHREFTRLKRSYILLDQFDQQYFFYQRLSDYLGLPEIDSLNLPKSRWESSSTLLQIVNKVTEEVLNLEALKTSPDPEVRAVGRCVELYQQQLEEENSLDFSTIQLEAYKLLRDNPQVLAEIQAQLKYIMVDEYQDTNTIQEKILALLTGEAGNICVVGDDDQGLYRFRGATIRNILEFPNKFPPGACKQIKLVTNYRSHPDIVGFYNTWMQQQEWTLNGITFRFNKTIQARAGQFPAVPTVMKVSATSEQAYHQEVLAFLMTLKEKETLTDWNQVAFLFKSVRHWSAVNLANFLERHGISVYSPRSNQFFDREEVRLMIGALIALFPQFEQARKWSDDAHLEIWDYYDQKCFTPFVQEVNKPENADLLRWVKVKGKQHRDMIQPADYAFTGLFYELLRFPLFSRYLGEDLLMGGMQNSRAMRNLATFSQLLNKFEYLANISVLTPQYLEHNLKSLFNQYFRYLEDGGINEYEDEAEYAPSGSVSFLTIHQSKGLEFPVVLVGSLYATPTKAYNGLDELLEPYLSRPSFEPLEHTKHFDFMRLYYTAFSRPQNILALTCQEANTGRRVPARSFQDIYAPLPNWRDIDLGQIPLEQVKKANLKREYSFTSHLILFEKCAEQYRFYRTLEFSPIRTNPILFGTLIHQTIEDIHKTVLRNEEHKLSEERIKGWFESNYFYLSKRERVYLAQVVKNMALKQVLAYYQRHKHDWTRIREAEVDVSLVKDEYILKGTIDLIRGKDGTVELVDFKSEKKPDVNNPKDREMLDRYRRQLEVYAHIVEQRYGLEVSKTHLYYTSEDAGNPYISNNIDKRSLDKTIKTFDEVVTRIESHDYAIPARPDKICKDCDMKHYCDAKNWKFRSQQP